MKKLMIGCAASVALTAVAASKTVYVDDNNYNPDYTTAAQYIAAGFDGTTEAKAFGEIQMACDDTNTKSGDTVLVLPGVYDKGEHTIWADTSDGGLCRVALTKGGLKIKSRDGAAATHIVGKKVGTANHGCGEGAVRCFGQYWAKTTLEGFTLRDGATEYTGDNAKSRGGAVFSWIGSGAPTYVVDCVVSNCTGYAGLFRNTVVIRSLVCDNDSNYGCMQTVCYNSIFARNSSSVGIIDSSYCCAVNCTLVGNSCGYGITGATVARNNLCICNAASVANELGATTKENNVLGLVDGDYQLIAPAIGDFRVLKGAVAETAGTGEAADGSDLTTAIPEEYLYLDFNGNPIPKTGKIMAGAIQESVAPTGGAVQFDGLSASKVAVVEGLAQRRAGVYAYPTSYPVQWKVEARPASGRFFAWTTAADHGAVRFPDRNDVAYMMPPPQTDQVMTNSFGLANVEWWVDPVKGSDTEGDGSSEKPFRTLQKAGNAGSNNQYIHCAAGTYAEGGESYWGVTNRVYLYWKNARYVSEGDKSDTTLVGALDPDDPTPSQPGCGPAAMRALCVAGSPYVCFTGFTFRDCGSLDKKSGESEATGHQGGVCRAGDYATFVDCLFTNCVAASSLFCNCRLQRCEVRGCQVASATLASGSALASCFLDVKFSDVYWPAGSAYNCTFRGDAVPAFVNYACVMSGGARLRASSAEKFTGCIAYGYGTYEANTGYVNVDPLFVSATDGRVMLRSPAFTCGEAPTADNCGAKYYQFATTGIEGEPLVFTDGKPMAGAYQRGVANAATVKAANGGLSVADKRTVEITEDAPLVLTMDEGTRPCFGYAVNGATNLFDGTPSRTITAAEATAGGSLVIEALYAPHWYVNADPTVGDDANTGFTPKTAKRTLEAALSLAGTDDTVHAAKGVYADGSALAKATYTIETRAFLRSHTTLVADEGPEKTFIVGEPAKGASDGEGRWDCGEGAVRGVYLSRWTKLSGFTITGGRTRCVDGQHYTDDNSGGGVLGFSEACIGDCVVENCIVSNNASFRGGGARFVTFRKCRIDGNLGYYNSAMGGECNFYGCSADGNVGGDQTFAYHAIVDCTFGPNNRQLGGDLAYVPGTPGVASARVSNTVTRCYAFMTNVYTATWCTGTVNIGHPMPEGLTKVSADELQLDADLRPIVGANAAVDQAVGPVAPGLDAETDVSGFPRVMNGRRDAGALEGDWRPNYGKDIGARFAVEAATPGVVESDAGKVVIAAGEALSGTWPVRAGQSVPRLMSFTVAEGGSATVTVDGVSTTYAAGAHERRFDATAANDVRIACTAGSVTVDRFRNELGALLLVR